LALVVVELHNSVLLYLNIVSKLGVRPALMKSSGTVGPCGASLSPLPLASHNKTVGNITHYMKCMEVETISILITL